MKKRALASLVLVASVFNVNLSLAAANYSVETSVPQYSQQYTPQYGQQYTPKSYSMPLKGQVFMVPAGAAIPAVTTGELSTATMVLGQGVSVALANDYYYNGQLVAPAGSQVNGNIIILKKAGRAGKNGQLKIKFTNITTPYGQMIPISGIIKTSDGKGTLVAATAKDTTKDYAKDLAIGAAGGAIMGTIMGPISGGKVGKGAALGTAVGAGFGLGKSIIDKGVDVTIPANSKIDIAIDQPITVNSTPRY